MCVTESPGRALRLLLNFYHIAGNIVAYTSGMCNDFIYFQSNFETKGIFFTSQITAMPVA